MNRCVLASLTAAACSGKVGSLSVDPERLDFGTIDFMQSVPEGGFAQQTVTLENHGDADLSVHIPGYDDEHLCLEGFESAEGEIELPPLGPGSSYVLLVGVAGYLTGERDTLVEGFLQLVSDGDEPIVDLPWSFTPVRQIGDDTGD